ncbi:MAG: hypothetical protein HN855_15105 [Anaerolineae bacterium]|nr:hypothetical protein [Anaerolineae bacterium]MBT7071879.1 hypothetical protein [Anaerolineae bacterium]MBT7326483.1 hypothetical protein [Anaerolineae bacterium]
MLNTGIPLMSGVISFIFAFFVLKRYFERKRAHLLLWGIGTIFYGIGGFCEFYYGAFGWNALVFRMWYLFGAILVAAWLGQGTVYLLAKRKLANTLMIILGIGSLYALFKIATAQLDPTLMIGEGHTGAELSGHAIITDGVRVLTPFFNIYGTATLVGGAAYSAWIFWRKRVLLHRTIGNLLIAAGALLPAFGGIFSRLQFPGALYLGEFFGVILLFIGFQRAVTPIEEKVVQAEAVA